uniref:Uncharacterized protein n=1 Tax=Acrobeloides nanus TaxID=290746 RepID=A0A914C8E4_9BILA
MLIFRIIQELFKVKILPTLLIFDENHIFFNENGVEFINSFLKMLDFSHDMLEDGNVLSKSLWSFLNWRLLLRSNDCSFKNSKKKLTQSRSQFYIDL